MADFNKVILVGRLTRDPELRYISSGTAVCEISLAIGRKWKGADGQMRDETTFVDVVIWGRQGENVNQYMKKGSQLLVEGRLNQERWEDKTTGQKRSKINVVADRTQFLDSRGSENGSYSAPAGAPAAQQSAPAQQAAPSAARPAEANFDDNFDVQGDEIPF